eukprot:CAMPEP_0196575410 /NCGR_PEP_ID=MMETSP1081-20130531/4901_1 /TAXON_ID=36882 /ORGANISM="Pyramimonas amylifera, Strain CCMP720" /LENGTH=169 /DNA_ID=CAMNT_0041893705 /DNA_START=61 /DNA_END=567 /DNA_ORIENTATION=-
MHGDSNSSTHFPAAPSASSGLSSFSTQSRLHYPQLPQLPQLNDQSNSHAAPHHEAALVLGQVQKNNHLAEGAEGDPSQAESSRCLSLPPEGHVIFESQTLEKQMQEGDKESDQEEQRGGLMNIRRKSSISLSSAPILVCIEESESCRLEYIRHMPMETGPKEMEVSKYE